MFEPPFNALRQPFGPGVNASGWSVPLVVESPIADSDHLLSVSARAEAPYAVMRTGVSGTGLGQRPICPTVEPSPPRSRPGCCHQPELTCHRPLGLNVNVTCLLQCFLGLLCDADDWWCAADYVSKMAPSGTTPDSKYRQTATNNRRATATIPLRRARLPPWAKRLSNHNVNWLVGCHRIQLQAS